MIERRRTSLAFRYSKKGSVLLYIYILFFYSLRAQSVSADSGCTGYTVYTGSTSVSA